MVCVIYATPVQNFIIYLLSEKENPITLEQKNVFYDNYLEEVSKIVLSNKIENFGLVGPIPYIFKIAQELKNRFPNIPIDGDAIDETTNSVVEFEIEEEESIEDLEKKDYFIRRKNEVSTKEH